MMMIASRETVITIVSKSHVTLRNFAAARERSIQQRCFDNCLYSTTNGCRKTRCEVKTAGHWRLCAGKWEDTLFTGAAMA
jgi:hypothetical protein